MDQRAQRCFALRSLPHSSQEPCAERVHALVHEVLFRREVVEDRLLGDIDGPGDLGDADLLEATLQKETLGRVGDRPARLLLLPLSKAQLGVHAGQGYPKSVATPSMGMVKRSSDTK